MVSRIKLGCFCFIHLIIVFSITNIYAYTIPSINLYIINAKNHTKDRSQLLGVARAVNKYLKTKNAIVNIEEYNISQLKAIVDKVTNNHNFTIILPLYYHLVIMV